MPLRPYQREVLRNSLRDYRAGIRRQLWILPTGGGKTRCVSRLPDLLKQQPGQQGFFLVNRDDLVWQAAEEFRKQNPKLTVDVEKADTFANPNADVIVASIQTISRKGGVADRCKRFNINKVQWIVIDEAHFSPSDQYIHALTFFRAYKGNPYCDNDRTLIGITATPNRGDSVGLECIFDKITAEIPIREMMETGPVINGEVYSYLAPIRAYRVSTDYDISMAKTRKGDFAEADLTAALDTPERNNLILEKYLEFGEGLPAVAFTVGVQHSHNLANHFTRNGVLSYAVSGDTPRKERDRLYAAYAAREVKMLASCEALTIGWDRPEASCALMTAPTKSGLKFTQCIGRVLRRFPSVESMQTEENPAWIKKYAVVIDFVDLVGKHSIQTVPTLFGLKADFDLQGGNANDTAKEVQKILKQYPTLGLEAKNIEDLRHQVDSVDIFRAPLVRPDVRRLSRFSWLEIFDGILQLGGKEATLEIRQNSLGKFELYQSRDGIRNLVGQPFAKLAEALQAGDALVPKSEYAIHVTRARWRAEPPTEAQCRMVWRSDERVKKRFVRSSEFFAFAVSQHNTGDPSYSKGGLSRIIDKFVLSKAGQPQA